MLRATRLSFILILLCQLLFIATANANESYLQTLSGKLKQNDSCVVIDDKFRNLPLNEWNQLTHLSVNNLVSFELRHDTSIYYYNRSFTCSLNVTIKYYTSRDQNTPEEISNVDLVVKYDTAKGSSYPTIAQYKFKDAFKVVVVINSITSPEWGENIPAIFRVKNQITVDRKYPFSPVVTGALEINEVTDNPSGNISTFSIGSTPIADRKLSITWAQADFPGSTELDLEWTYIDKETFDAEKIRVDYTSPQGDFDIPDAVVEKLMRNNSTRVTITTELASEYTISLPYAEGYLLVRIRGAHQQIDPAMRVTTNWVYRNGSNKTVCYKIQTPHEADLNYQYTAAFAEEGKKKEIITYFDGTQKERQAVTLMNSDGTKKTENGPLTPTATVAETIYDVLGRPTMQVLPAPTKNSSLGFYTDFNQNNNGSAYSHKDIILTSSTSEICGPGAAMMGVGSGASRYYSSNNEFLNDADYPFTKYVPDAGKKPYSLTQYTADNSGRVKRSWGVGDQFQPSETSKGHSTDYYYGKPSQKELDRLFGSEVGIASHYLKNMVVDPNGQISVTYVNAQGKTIATALAGAAPLNLEALPSSTKPDAQSTLTQRIIANSDFQRNASELKMQASSVYLATTNGDFTVYYNVDPLSVVTKHGTPEQQFCSNCYYEILVEVKNDCGEVVETHTAPPFTLNDVTCKTEPPRIAGSFNLNVKKIGEYTVTYTLQLSEQQIKYHTDYYIQNNSDLLKLQYFFQQELNKLDLKGCYSSCESCKTLGTQEVFRSKVKEILGKDPFEGIDLTGTAGAALEARINAMYVELKANCDAISCEATNSCEVYLLQMKEHVKAGGQYAQYDVTNEGVYSLVMPNINLIPKFYETNTPDLQFISAAGTQVSRKSLSISDLIREYIVHPEWADDLVKHHVEYCSYEWCMSNESSYNFDRTIKEYITSGQEAIDKGYYNRTPNKLLSMDPFFANGGAGASRFQLMSNDLAAYSKAMNMRMKNASNVYMTDKSIIGMVDWVLYCKPGATTATHSDFIASWTCNLPANTCRSTQMEWEMYRNFYLQLKSQHVAFVKALAKPNCTNCFIGTDGLELSQFGGCAPAGPCPSSSDFQITGTSDQAKCEGDCMYQRHHYKIRYIPGAVTKRVAVRVKRTQSGVADEIITFVFEPGETEKEIGTEVARLAGRSCVSGGPVCTARPGGVYSIIAEPLVCTPPSLCASDPRRADYASVQRVFYEYVNMESFLSCVTQVAPATSPTPSEVVATLRLKLLEEIDSDWVPAWRIKLIDIRNEVPAFSGIDDVLINNLVNALKAVAVAYLNSITNDPEALRIVNTLPPSVLSSFNHSSFEQAFNEIIGSTLVKKGFSHYLLEGVYPYDKYPVWQNQNSGDLSTTICSNIATLKTRYQGSGFSGTFHQYLQQELEDDYHLTELELLDIESRCSVTPICRYMNAPLILPAVFTRVVTNQDDLFVDCSRVSGLKTSFGTFFNSEMTLSHPLYTLLYTSFLNQGLGYALSFSEYVSFDGKCPGTAVLYNKPASPLLMEYDMVCVKDILRRAYERAGQEYDYYITQERKKFRNKYISTCLSNEASASINGTLREYHYTLYYYDQSGNLVKTIPPEGVRFLTDAECEQVDEFRNFPVANCDGTGIPTTTDKLATLTSIGNLWNAQTSKSLEMWLYSGENSTDRQVRWVTANGQYMFQAAIHDQKLWVELYTLEVDGAALNITLTNQAVADVSHIPLQTWSHLVAQSTDFTTAEWTLYLDGKKLTLSNPANAPTYPFSWEIAPGPTVPDDDLAVLKHVRLYNRSLSDGEVAANYRNSCLSPVGLPAGTPMDLWARFNIPAPGSETTTGAGSTNEFVNRFIVPQHGLPSNYVFNSFNKVIKQVSPDGGTTEFWYDKLSRLVASQNSEQKVPTDPADPTNRYSFTKYDALGRIREVGEKTAGIDITTINLSNQTELYNWYAQGTDKSLTQTVYDANPVEAPAGAILENLRHRVSASIFRETRSAQKINATYISYDISGNAKTVYQEIGELKALDNTTGIKKLEYDFDLVSGKVNMLTYQKDKGDQFFYKYEYDADNRIKSALTSRDGGTWNLEARYSYYLHGPLARVELGKNEVQGIDYAYTLSGWLKAINGKDLIPGEDMGGDGTTFSAAKNFSRDELAFTLGYFNGDYAPIGGSNANAISRKFEPEVFPAQTPYAGTGAPLYNGNISNSTVHMAPEILGAAKGYTYRYDQLNRLLTMRQHTGLPTGHGSIWNKTSETDDYKESITYDANGNILTFLRNASAATQMDDLAYQYNIDAKGNLLNNKLRHVDDEISASAFDVDIDDQSVDNHEYDKIGNLISDVAEGLEKIKWTPYGKINSIQKANNVIQYEYDATGNRVWKSSNNSEKRTYYVRDPQGNVLAVYNYDALSGNGGQGGILSWAEQHLYGSNRLGLLTPEITVTQDWQYQQNGPNSFIEGKRVYELTNHLGNVLATINDRKIAVDQDNNGINDYFRAELLSVTDYYAFGMQMPGRKWSLGNYRFGFNGKENDNEVKEGDGLQQDYGMRVYDARLGKFLSVDPLIKDFPWYTPYQFAGNKPIIAVDLDGEEEKIVVSPLKNNEQNGEVKVYTSKDAEFNTYLKSVPPEFTGMKSGVGTLYITQHTFSAWLNPNFNNYTYKEEDVKGAKKISYDHYTNGIMRTIMTSKWSPQNIKLADFGVKAAAFGIDASATIGKMSTTVPVGGNTNELSAEAKATFSLRYIGDENNNNYVNASISGSSELSGGFKKGKNIPGLSVGPDGELFGYVSFMSSGAAPVAGTTANESVTNFRLGAFKLQYSVNPDNGKFDLKIGASTKPGIEFKTTARKKTITTSKSGLNHPL